MDEFKNQLIGQKEGLQHALDMIETTKKSIENCIKTVNEQLEKF